MKQTKLTDSQTIAAVFYGLYHNWQIVDIYKLCYPEDNTPNLTTAASAWHRGKRIANIFQRVQNELKGNGIEFDGRSKTLQTETDLQNIDFTDKGQFIKYLNDAANRITDDKLKNDILKMLSDHLDFKDESKRDESNNIQRFYLPLRCQDCKLYLEAAKNV